MEYRGGIHIKDATATPDDVKQGKIFYNNDGKQSGIYIPSSKMVKSIILPSPSGPTTEDDLEDPESYHSSDGSSWYFRKSWLRTYPNYCQVIDGIDYVIGVEVNGKYGFCPSIIGCITIWAYWKDGYTYPWFYQKSGKIYICKDSHIPEGNQITLYYMDA